MLYSLFFWRFIKLKSMRRAACIILLTLCSSCLACLWDYDTLRDEKRGLPGVAEVLAGQWERHSDFFYQQRIKAMRENLAGDAGRSCGDG